MPPISKPHKTAFLTYALNEGGCLVHVDSVPNGNECGCVCPCCKSRLCAKNGGYEREHHFSHLGGADCVGGVESALHIMAKEVLQRVKCVRLPAIADVCESRLLNLDEVEVEVRDDNTSLRPDCIGRYEDKMIWIEFKWTHAVNQEKKEQIISRRIDCLEIDLNGCELDPNQVEDLLINQEGYRVWICNPAIDAALAEVAARKAKEEEAIIAALEEADARRASEYKATKETLREANERRLNELMNDPRYFLAVDNNKNSIVRNFALTDKYEIVDLRTYNVAEEGTHRYYCLSCGREVRFYTSSNKKFRYFKHIDKKCADCTDERYLIGVAKAILFENFYTSETFDVSIGQTRKCCHRSECKLYSEKECIKIDPKSFDLKSLGYNCCEKDKDLDAAHLHLYLSRPNGKGGEIGIIINSEEGHTAVSSSLRLIKVVVNSVNDLDNLRKKNLRDFHNCTTHNFRRQNQFEEVSLDVTRKIPRFLLYPNGDSRVIRIPFKCRELSQLASPDAPVQLYLINFDLGEATYNDAVNLGLMHCHKMGLSACYCTICSRSKNCDSIGYHLVACPRFVLNNLLKNELKEKYSFVRIVE